MSIPGSNAVSDGAMPAFRLDMGSLAMSSRTFTRQMTLPGWEALFSDDASCKAYLMRRILRCYIITVLSHVAPSLRAFRIGRALDGARKPPRLIRR